MNLEARVLILNKGFERSIQQAYLVIRFEDGRIEQADVSPNRFGAMPDVGRHIFITYTEGTPLTIHRYSTNPPAGMIDPDASFVTKEFPIILAVYGAISFLANIITSIGLIALMVVFWNVNSNEEKTGLLGLSLICCAGNAIGWFYAMFDGGIWGIIGVIMGGLGFVFMFAIMCVTITKFNDK